MWFRGRDAQLVQRLVPGGESGRWRVVLVAENFVPEASEGIRVGAVEGDLHGARDPGLNRIGPSRIEPSHALLRQALGHAGASSLRHGDRKSTRLNSSH